jgi:nucleoside-diphosphate-sugar epimerase
MQPHVVIGSGPVGSGIALQLAENGTPVMVITRRGGGPNHPLVTKTNADATDAAALVRFATGAAAIYNCVNPPYHQWDTAWPPLHNAMMHAAERTGAVLVMMDNLYGFGPGTAMPMHEGDPTNALGPKGSTRARMEAELLAAHAAGRLRATFARASDFYGPNVLDAALGSRAWPKILAGKKVALLGALDIPRSYSYMPDVVQTMTTIATDERAWGQGWHVPNAAPLTQRQMVDALAKAAGTTPRCSSVPRGVIKAMGTFNPMMKALLETWYQFDAPWITDSKHTEQTFNLRATPLLDGALATAQWWQARLKAGER